MINKDFFLTWKEEETLHLFLSNRSCFSPTPGMQEASMKLTESLHEVYEPDWYGREDVKMVGEVRARMAPYRSLGSGRPSVRLPLSAAHSTCSPTPSYHFSALIMRGQKPCTFTDTVCIHRYVTSLGFSILFCVMATIRLSS